MAKYRLSRAADEHRRETDVRMTTSEEQFTALPKDIQEHTWAIVRDIIGMSAHEKARACSAFHGAAVGMAVVSGEADDLPGFNVLVALCELTAAVGVHAAPGMGEVSA